VGVPPVKIRSRWRGIAAKTPPARIVDAGTACGDPGIGRSTLRRREGTGRKLKDGAAANGYRGPPSKAGAGLSTAKAFQMSTGFIAAQGTAAGTPERTSRRR